MFVDESAAGTSTARRSAEGTELPLALLADEIGALAAHIAAATCQWLVMVGEFDRREGYLEWGMHSTWVWLAWRCGLTPRAAQEHVRVARALEELPRIRAAFGRGELTYSKVRALTRVASDDNEELLLSHARYATAAQLERICRAYRGVTLAEADRARERRHFSYSWEEDGSFRFDGLLPGEEGALLVRALEAGFEAIRAEAEASPAAEADEERSAERDGRPSQADALMAVAETALASGDASSTGGDRHQLVVHVDADTLVMRQGSEGTATIAHGPAIPMETARRLGCDAAVVMSVERRGKPLSVGRKTRTIPPALRRAVMSRDECCRFPGCENSRFTDLHHIDHWAHGGATSYGNLIRLCRRHHRLLHEGSYSVEARSAERFVFRGRNGSVIPDCPRSPRGFPGELRRRHRRHAAAIDPETCHSLGRGERFDLDLTIMGLCEVAPAHGPRGP